MYVKEIIYYFFSRIWANTSIKKRICYDIIHTSCIGEVNEMPRRTLENAMQTKKKILETAQRLFSRRGFERTSLSDIAKGAGCTRGAIYWHFENKEELLMSLLESLEQEQFGMEFLNDACDPNSYNPLSKLKKWLSALCDEKNIALLNSTLISMVIMIFNGGSNPELKEMMQERRIQKNELIAKALKNIVSKGQLPSDLIIDLAVEHLCVIIVGTFHRSRVTNTNVLKNNFPLFIELEFKAIRELTEEKLRTNSLP